jgi:lipoate---protein ligase
MRLFDQSFQTPAENLACDEAFLEALENGTAEPTLRFWESPVPFVVVGYANQVAMEVNIAECERLQIPILRRSSGGGTVVQGPGCLNYNLTLPIADETSTITDTNCYVMCKHREAFTKILEREVKIQGHTDLTIDGLKFSGNAQRRKRNALVFHGCFLLDFDLDLISQLLSHPSKEPDYRAKRSHHRFLTNLKIPSSIVKEALSKAWNAHGEIIAPPLDELIRERFSNDAWNRKF